MYKEDCWHEQQAQSFLGVGAQHQNAHAERDIQTISNWARHMMVHAAIHWPSDGADNICCGRLQFTMLSGCTIAYRTLCLSITLH